MSLAHLRSIIAYNVTVTTERAVVYDDDVLYLPEPDFAETSAPPTAPATSTGRAPRRSQALRHQLSALNQQRATSFAHEATSGSTPSIVYQQHGTTHGNFFPASYRRITANPAWSARLEKAYTASSRIPHSNARQRRELDCANSSDALLMNVFCHPTSLRSAALQALLGISQPLSPCFGHRARIPLRDGHIDRTEFDMLLQDADHLLLVEAKLSEGDFQTARPALMDRYSSFKQVFDTDSLPHTHGQLCSYQLLRSILAAHHLQASFAVMLDARRTDLVEDAFLVYRTVRSAHLRSRLHVITWQEIAACVPRTLQRFLLEKYGILAAR